MAITRAIACSGSFSELPVLQFDQLCCSLGSQRFLPYYSKSGLLLPGLEAALLLKEPESNLRFYGGILAVKIPHFSFFQKPLPYGSMSM